MPPALWNVRSKWPTPFGKSRLRPISAHNVSTTGDSEKSSITTNIKFRMGFPTSYRWTAYVTHKSTTVWRKIFQFFGMTFNFCRIKYATKLRCVKTSSVNVTEQSISYEESEKYSTESVSFHLKYWLKLTYPVVAGAVHAVSVAQCE